MNDSDTKVVEVTEEDLSKFICTVQGIEKDGSGLKHGIFKMKIAPHSRVKGTTLQELLKILRKYLDKICILQEFRRYPLCTDVYGYLSVTPVDKNLIACYVKKMVSLYTYSEKTCCSEILKHGSLEDVVHHYYEFVKDCSVDRSSGRYRRLVKGNTMNGEEELKMLLETGQQLRDKYHATVSQMSQGSTDSPCSIEVKPTYDCCSCGDCFTESEDDEGDELFHRERDEVPLSHHEKYPKYSTGLQVERNTIKVTENFSMSNIFSVLDMLPHKYEGLQLPYLYVGEKHSTVTAHVEDAFLYAANYLHFGQPKIWISIVAEHFGKTVELLSSLKMELANTSCRGSITHKYYIPTLDFLKKNKIPYQITVQHPGEMVILCPKVIHFGFNLGPNIAEAVNFGTISWILRGVESMQWRCRCFGDLAIHIDLKHLVAAFYPEMLKSLLQGQYTMTASEMQQARNKIEQNGVENTARRDAKYHHRNKSVKVFNCPDPQCKTSYQEHRHRLVQHVNAKHASHSDNYLNQINEMYPEAGPVKSSGKKCPVCSSTIVGSVTHLERHMRWQSTNSKLSEVMLQKYKDELTYLQASIRRKTKVNKSKLKTRVKRKIDQNGS